MALVGILGGVGPAAGILLHQTLLQHTESNGIDQGHLNVCHISRSGDIASRVDFLNAYAQHKAAHSTSSSETTSSSDDDKGESEDSTHIGVENPADGMARTFALLHKLDAPVIAGIPCITFHTQPIWSMFERQIRAATSHDTKHNVRCLHMLDETVAFIAHVAPQCRKIGVLSTTGTRTARVFHDVLAPRGYDVIHVDNATQLELQDTILNPQWGIKSNAPVVQPRCVANCYRYARELIRNGAELIVLGCTELPFAFAGATAVDGVSLLDPLVALARALIREVDPLRLKPLVLEQ